MNTNIYSYYFFGARIIMEANVTLFIPDSGYIARCYNKPGLPDVGYALMSSDSQHSLKNKHINHISNTVGANHIFINGISYPVSHSATPKEGDILTFRNGAFVLENPIDKMDMSIENLYTQIERIPRATNSRQLATITDSEVSYLSDSIIDKVEVKDIPSSYSANVIKSIKPKSYKVLGSDKSSIGFISEEVLEQYNPAVEKNTMAIDYISIISHLVGAVQNLYERLDHK